MEYIIIIVVIIIIISASSNSGKKKNKNNRHFNTNYNKPAQKQQPPVYKPSNQSEEATVVTPSTYKPLNITIKVGDSDIIDVSNESYNLNNTYSNKESKVDRYNVPYWGHQYIYSLSELSGASSNQKKFYSLYKEAFLKGEYWDLQGNLNYAFILLFDLLNQFDNHKDSNLLEKQLEALGLHYPRTKSYCSSFLIKKLESIGDEDSILRIIERNPYDYYAHDYWKAGNRYKKKLNLNSEEVELLNKLWYPSNNFCEIEFCWIEVIKLYLVLFKELENDYEKQGTTLIDVFRQLADYSVKSEYNSRRGTEEYKYRMENATNHLYNNIFKYCENEVRGYYGHKRKLNTDLSWSVRSAQEKYSAQVVSIILGILPNILKKTVQQPDEATEIALNEKNTTRWKFQFDLISNNYNGDPEKFLNEIIHLGKLNEKNPSVENIFFEASKFIAKTAPETSLILYIHYLHHDLKSITFDNKQLTKSIQKSLFKTQEHLTNFESIVQEFINDKDLDKAVNSVSDIYKVKRKKIQIDRTTIKEVQEQHSETVELLNEYLKDENEDFIQSIQDTDIDEIKMNFTSTKQSQEQNNKYLCDISFTPIQVEILDFFAKNSFSISVEDFETYAKKKNLFKNQLIDSINESCYDLLDDILIEEEDEFYTIDNSNYNTILAK